MNDEDRWIVVGERKRRKVEERYGGEGSNLRQRGVDESPKEETRRMKRKDLS